MDASTLQLIILPAGIIAVLFALYLARDVLSRDTGTKAMEDVAGTIYEGAVAFIRRQYTTIFGLAIIGALVIGALIAWIESPDVADVQHLAGLPIGIMTAIAFFVGALCSMASGIIGMFISVKANVRTASAARRSLVEAVQVAMRGGAVSGFLVVSLSLLGVWGIFTIYSTFIPDVTVAQAPFLIVGFGFGASFVALFAQLGGGIYTKAADVGSDLVGKVEKGIPEDDPRNAGVVADLVGDNVGDCAGRGADLFESTAAENIGAMILGVAVYAIASAAGWPNPQAWIFFPLVVRGFGLLATSDHFQPWQANEGHCGSAWVTLGALGGRAPDVWMGTTVTCPTLRYHPAIVAEAFASLALLYPGRIFLGVGSGEALNEQAATGTWPA